MSLNNKQIIWPGLCQNEECDVCNHFCEETEIGRGVAKVTYPARYCLRRFDKPRNSKSVVKFFIDKYIFEQDFWSREIEAHKKAKQLAIVWNESEIAKAKINVLVPKQCPVASGEIPLRK